MPVTRSCGIAAARKGNSTDANTVPAAAASTSRRLCLIEVPSAPHDDRLADLAQREPVMLADERFLNPFDRFHEGLVAQLKRLMVDGHDRTGARGVRHGECLFGRAVVVDVGVVGRQSASRPRRTDQSGDDC